MAKNTSTKRTPTSLIQQKVYREDMTWEEERDFVKHMFGKYEKAGFFTIFHPKRTLPENEKMYSGQLYKIIGRCPVPTTKEEERALKVDVMNLPAWTIEFEDEHRMVAYPEDICKLDVSGMAAC